MGCIQKVVIVSDTMAKDNRSWYNFAPVIVVLLSLVAKSANPFWEFACRHVEGGGRRRLHEVCLWFAVGRKRPERTCRFSFLFAFRPKGRAAGMSEDSEFFVGMERAK